MPAAGSSSSKSPKTTPGVLKSASACMPVTNCMTLPSVSLTSVRVKTTKAAKVSALATRKGCHRLIACTMEIEPDMQCASAVRSTLPLVMPSAIISLVSNQARPESIRLSKSSRTYWTCESSDFSVGILILVAVTALKTLIASTPTSIVTELAILPSLNALPDSAVSGPTSTS